MRYMPLAPMLLGMGLLLTGCSRTETRLMWEGTCQEHRLAFYEVRRPRIGMVALSHRIDFDGASFEVDPSNLYHGKPFDDNVYGSAAWHLLPDSDEPQGDVRQVMLYVPPGAMRLGQFQALKECLASQAADYTPALAPYRLAGNRYRFVGLVYGSEDDFVDRFFNNQGSVLEIDPDGTVQFADGSGVSNMGLAPRVVMPGRILKIETPSLTSLDELRQYRDKQGRSVEDRYTVEVSGP